MSREKRHRDGPPRALQTSRDAIECSRGIVVAMEEEDRTITSDARIFRKRIRIIG
jgi:hypothetical protein